MQPFAVQMLFTCMRITEARHLHACRVPIALTLHGSGPAQATVRG